MSDEFDDLKRAMDAATPAPDAARRAANIALAEKNFADLQGSRDGARPMSERGPLARLGQGVKTMIGAMTTRGGLTATTALVAVGFVMITPVGQDFLRENTAGPEVIVLADDDGVVLEERTVGPELGQDTVADRLTGTRDRQEGDVVVSVPAESAPVDLTRRAPAPNVSDSADESMIMAEPLMEEAESFAAGRSLSKAAPPGVTADSLIMPAPEPVIVPETDTEAFSNSDTNPLKVVTEEPVSTFSIDVDTASYAVVRSSLMSAQLPPRDAVRVEEMINYFPYDYAAPEGDVPFQPTITVTDTPWNAGTQLVHIGIQGTLPAIEDRPPLNLVFLIDTSGSMQDGNKLPLLKQSFRLMLSELRPEDEVSIVTYAGSAGQVLDPTRAAEQSTILAALDRLEAGGSTAGQAGLQQAYAVAESMAGEGEVTRVLLATDGDFNVGLSDPDALKDFIAEKRNSGTYLSVLGFGRGNLDDATMQALAQNGNGTAAYIDTLHEARKVLVDQLTGALFPIANDVKIQVEFNPAEIAEYRLIGYETRALNREDFNNDKVDAGDIGAGHTVTAIYEVTPVGSDAVRNGPLRYSDEPEVTVTPGDGELGFFKLRYKAPGEATSRLIEEPIMSGQDGSASEDVAFSIAMAGFGQLLRGGAYLGAWGWDEAIELANGARGADPFGYRIEAVNLMRLAERLDQ